MSTSAGSAWLCLAGAGFEVEGFEVAGVGVLVSVDDAKGAGAGGGSERDEACEIRLRKDVDDSSPFLGPPLRPMTWSRRDAPLAFIFASRRSLRSRSNSAARAAAASSADADVVSVIESCV